MDIIKKFSLQSYNTLALPAVADYFITIHHIDDLIELSRNYLFNFLPWLILGSGSNVVFAEDYRGVIVHLNLNQIEYHLTDDAVYIHADAGVIWDELIQDTLAKGYAGLENLSLIPGTVGAAPVQNIGAYGTELKYYFYKLLAWDRQQQCVCELGVNDCQFSYRHSVFKNEPGRYIILRIVLKLSRVWKPQLGYQALKAAMANQEITAMNIRNKVCELRRSKLPDPATLPNAGSFFKNPCIHHNYFETLKLLYPALPSFVAEASDEIKVPAAWLIEQAGWRGKALGAVSMYEKQALVLVNHSNASGLDVLQLARRVQDDVWEKFGIKLEIEPQVFGALNE